MDKKKVEKEAEKLKVEMLDFLRPRSSDPDVLCSASANVFFALLVAGAMWGDEEHLPERKMHALDICDQIKMNAIRFFETHGM